MNTSDRPRVRWWPWVLLTLVAAVGIGLLFLRRSPDSQLARLRAQGHPVSLEDLERRLGPDAAQGRKNGLRLIQAGENIRLDRSRPVPSRSKTVEADDRAWAEANLGGERRAAWEQLHAELKKGPWCFADYTGGLFKGSLTGLSGVKGLANALQTEAIAAAIFGDSARAGAALNEGVRVGRLVESGVLMDYLVRVACDAIAARSAEFVFTTVSLDDATLAELQRGFRAAEGTNALARSLIAERAFALSQFQMSLAQLASAANAAAGLPPGTATPSSTGQDLAMTVYQVFLRNSDQRHYLSQMERLIQSLNHVGPASVKTVGDLENELRQDRFPWGRMLSRMTLPSLYKAAAKEFRHVTVMRCAQTACAVERYQLKHQKLPPTLDALVPEFLESVPEDPMTGEPLKYLIRGEGYVVYGVGEDGTDDRGQEPQKKPAGWDYTFVVE